MQHDALDVQNARAARGATQRDKQFYTRSWTSVRYPDYVPEQKAFRRDPACGATTPINSRSPDFQYLEEGFRKPSRMSPC